MIKSKTTALTTAERCRNILGANCLAHLNTVKADSKGSKSDIHTSKVHYMFNRGKPYLWVQEGDLHNTNIIIDERGSLSISNVLPGPLTSLLKSLRKMPAQVALAGVVVPLKNDKVQIITESLSKSVLSEYKKVSEASYAVSALLRSASVNCGSRCESLQEILDQNENYAIYKFDVREIAPGLDTGWCGELELSCTFVDGSGEAHDLDINDIDVPKTNPLLSFSAKLIDGINQSQARRRALMLFCFEHYNATVRDALMLSIDQKGFDVLGKVQEGATADGQSLKYMWKEFRFTFKDEASDLESFCRFLVELEEETLQSVKSYSGLG